MMIRSDNDEDFPKKGKIGSKRKVEEVFPKVPNLFFDRIKKASRSSLILAFKDREIG